MKGERVGTLKRGKCSNKGEKCRGSCTRVRFF